jgi:hypothetical protein
MIAAALYAVLEVPQSLVQILPVRAPRDPIYTWGRALLQALICLLEQRHLDVAEEVIESCPFSFLCSLSDPLHYRERAFPVLCPERVS